MEDEEVIVTAPFWPEAKDSDLGKGDVGTYQHVLYEEEGYVGIDKS